MEEARNNEESQNEFVVSEIKKFWKKVPVLLFRNGVWTAIVLYIIIAAIICSAISDIASTRWFLWFLWLTTAIAIGSLCSFFYGKFEVEENIDFNAEPITNDHQKELTFRFFKWLKHDTQYPLWEILHWIAVFGFLGLTFVIMAWGMQSLFTDDDTGTKVIVWYFSFLTTFTLFWLVFMISRRGKKWQWFLLFYIVFDLLSAFTFNYFHFYHNVSQTQRMENSIKYSRELVEMVGTPISEEVTRLDSISKSEQVQTFLKSKHRIEGELDNISIERQNPKTKSQTYTWTDNNGNPSSSTKEVRLKTDKQLQNEEENATERLFEVNKQLNVFYLGTSGSSLYYILHKEDSLCRKIQGKISCFENEPLKKRKPIIRDSILNDINILGGMLRKTQLSGISNREIKDKIDIINSPEVTRLESIKSLFDALGRLFSSNTSEIEKSEDRLVYMSVTLSVLIDLLPMLLGLLVAISINRRKQ